jgi:hypothetical protein|mmetsp:Transcript_24691/g.73443  ORF Transcript_24691/g.73443 Transcript_24691/m.73443 type:complete len:256 (+) Transcript_24691:78-845(+)
MPDWVQDTGAKRSRYDTEEERRPVRPDLAPKAEKSHAEEHYTDFVGELATGAVIERAMKDRLDMEEAKLNGDGQGYVTKEEKEKKREEEEELDEKDGARASEIDDLEVLREKRRKQMKEAQEARVKYQQLGHGEYQHIEEEVFLKTVTSSKRCIVHFHHRNFERCKIMDMHLAKMAKKFMGTKFVTMDAEKCAFFVDKLAIKTLPCVIVFLDGVAVGRQVGFDELPGDDFSTAVLAWRFKEVEGIEEEFGPEDDF